MDFKSLRSEQVIEESFLEEYERERKHLYMQLVNLNTNIFILNHVLRFPFHLFVPPTRSLFFRKVFENFFFASLLIITRIGSDKGKEFLTLSRFKNKVRSAVKKGYQEDFQTCLKEVRFDSATREMLDRARTLRNQRVAHILEDVVLGNKEEAQVVFGDIINLRDQFEKLLDAISFGTSYIMLPLQYYPETKHQAGQDSHTDIEEFLDLIAFNSTFLHLPETNPSLWKIKANTLPQSDLDAFNKYRKKAGLQEYIV
jgi:hypothetical protein